MPSHPLFVAAVALVLLTSCATEPKLPPNAPKPAERATLQDISFLPPQEPGWLLDSETDDRKVYAIKGRDTDHNYVATIAISPFPAQVVTDTQFFDWVKTTRLTGEPKKRKLIEAERDWDANRKEKCVRYRSVVEDYVARNSGKAPFVQVNTFGLACRHPNDPSKLVETTVVERGLPEDVLPTVAEKMATALFRELRF